MFWLSSVDIRSVAHRHAGTDSGRININLEIKKQLFASDSCVTLDTNKQHVPTKSIPIGVD